VGSSGDPTRNLDRIRESRLDWHQEERDEGETEIELEHVDAEETEETAQPIAASAQASEQVEQPHNVIA